MIVNMFIRLATGIVSFCLGLRIKCPILFRKLKRHQVSGLFDLVCLGFILVNYRQNFLTSNLHICKFVLILLKPAAIETKLSLKLKDC